jgi:class 3 adenylate cyclase
MDLAQSEAMGDVVGIFDEERDAENAVRPDRPTRVLATVLFTDIVDSTGLALRLGDSAWLALQEQHDDMARREVRRFGGRHRAATGDGLVATFDGAAAGVCCATEVAKTSLRLGVEVRAGLHCGEYECRGPRVGGIVFHVAARVLTLAQPSEVLVSGTVKDLVAGSALRFTERGRHPLRGLPGLWMLYAAEAAASDVAQAVAR